MKARKCLTGVELQPLMISPGDEAIPGFEIRLRWIDLTRPEVPKIGEPLVVDKESLLAMIDGLREQIRRVQSGHQGTPGH